MSLGVPCHPVVIVSDPQRSRLVRRVNHASGGGSHFFGAEMPMFVVKEWVGGS